MPCRNANIELQYARKKGCDITGSESVSHNIYVKFENPTVTPNGYVLIDGSRHNFQYIPIDKQLKIDVNFFGFNKIEFFITDGSCYFESVVLKTDFSFYTSSNSYCETTTALYNKPIIFDVRGCTNPTSPNYNPNANGDDGSCLPPIYGCTDKTSNNYNPLATIDDGTCLFTISGCTSPLSPNYNPLATVDDGSCVSKLIVKGCTNPLALNYNSTATDNDGSCVFSSGCTDTFAPNYDPTALIDDGSCKCNDLLINIEIPFLFSGCTHKISFDYRIIIDCEEIFDFYLNHKLTLIEILEKLNLSVKIWNSEYTQKNKLYQFNVAALKNEILQHLVFSGDSEKCALLKDLITTELKKDCNFKLDNQFTPLWQHADIIFDKSGLFQISMLFENIGFPVNLELDNIKIIQICEDTVFKTYLREENVGFEKELIVDNSKIGIGNNQLIKNTKILDLRVDAATLIEKDVLSYLQFNNNLLTRPYKDFENFDGLQNPTDIFTNDNWSFKKIKLLYHTNIYNYCNATSKGFESYYQLRLATMIDKKWSDLLNNFIPATAIRNNHTHFFRNLLFDNVKFRYRRYTLSKSLVGFDDNEEIFDEETNCTNGLVKTKIVAVLEYNNFCALSNQKVDYLMFNDSPYGVGRFVSYKKVEKAIIEKELNIVAYDVC